ncbi:uncharacterized protein LOC120425996 [Culex pipiens pallens]|uniref:uncharacterized protein LOC120425996 n=1 Tax=Culex pipiens pallens TaxID=42434 RepID=UPI0019547FF1|nr:uncharacterized protein LOC120425996 [Culex pipiens pallens]
MWTSSGIYIPFGQHSSSKPHEPTLDALLLMDGVMLGVMRRPHRYGVLQRNANQREIQRFKDPYVGETSSISSKETEHSVRLGHGDGDVLVEFHLAVNRDAQDNDGVNAFDSGSAHVELCKIWTPNPVERDQLALFLVHFQSVLNAPAKQHVDVFLKSTDIVRIANSLENFKFFR